MTMRCRDCEIGLYVCGNCGGYVCGDCVEPTLLDTLCRECVWCMDDAEDDDN